MNAAHRHSRVLPAAMLAVAAASAPAWAGTLAFDDPGLAADTPLTVSVASVAPGGPYPNNYTSGGRNISPPVSWTAGPAATRSYVLIMQDPDAPGLQAAVHWLLYNVPPSFTALPRYLRNEAEPSKPLGSAQGPNFHGSFGYSGPRPPVGDPPHHYHLQVFALDRVLKVKAGSALPDVERAMSGHVLARGELVTVYAAPDPKAPKAKGTPAQATPPT